MTGREASPLKILKCEDLNKICGYGNNRIVALDRIGLSVNKGEFIAIVSTSGSSKSMLLRLIGSVDKPLEGRIMIEGIDISILNPAQSAMFRRKKVGLIYQFYNLIPTLIVRQNILMPPLLDKGKPNQEHFEQVVNALGISGQLESLPVQLSGGQQQRAIIARSLIYRPVLLLADGPTGDLDRKNSKEITDMLKRSNRSLNQIILLITHDEGITLEAEYVIATENGRIIGDRRRG